MRTNLNKLEFSRGQPELTGAALELAWAAYLSRCALRELAVSRSEGSRRGAARAARQMRRTRRVHA